MKLCGIVVSDSFALLNMLSKGIPASCARWKDGIGIGGSGEYGVLGEGKQGTRQTDSRVLILSRPKPGRAWTSSDFEMVSNGADSPSSPTASSSSQSNKPSIELRRSIDSQRSNTSSPVHLNGTRIPNTLNGDESDADIISALKQELESTREEKDNLASQYRNLLSKLTTMRTTLGNKLKQDAVCSVLFTFSESYTYDYLVRKN